jgi:hypothetical protein
VIVKALLNRVFSAQETAFAYNPRALPEAKVSRPDWPRLTVNLGKAFAAAMM